MTFYPVVPITHPLISFVLSVFPRISPSKLLLYILMKKFERSICFLIWYCSVRGSASIGTHKAEGEGFCVPHHRFRKILADFFDSHFPKEQIANCGTGISLTSLALLV